MALPNGSSAWTAGDVYYLADGNYNLTSMVTIGCTGTATSSSYITIKKATASDHGTDTGWSTSMGDGQAIFNGWANMENQYALFLIVDPYTVIDGQVGENDGSVTPHGIKLVMSPSYVADRANRGIRIEGGLDYITLKHIELQGAGCNLPGTDVRHDAIYHSTTTASNPGVGHYYGYLYSHDWNRCCGLLNGVTNMMFEHNFVARVGSGDAGVHSNGIASSYCYGNLQNTYRYNTFKDIAGTNAVACKDNYLTGDPTWICSGETRTVPRPNYNIYFYGNLFYTTSSTVTSPIGSSQSYRPHYSDGTLTNTGCDDSYDWFYYNNTHVDLNYGEETSVHNMTVGNYQTGKTSYAYNNLFVNSSNISWSVQDAPDAYIIHNYNSYGNSRDSSTQNTGTGNNESGGQYNVATSIFSNYSGRDYRLYYATDPGAQLADPYNYDPLGNIRGGDGAWDRGMYEYTGTQTIHYIRSGASGDGSNWTNALNALPADLERGHTYYIADGTYSGYTFNDGLDGTKYITIKKATASDHGNNTGWPIDNSYGDGSATFTGAINFNTGYYIFDGATRGTDWQSGYGFVIDRSAGTSGPCIGIPAYGTSTNVQNVSVKYCELIGFVTGDTNAPDGFFMNPTGAGNSNISMGYCYIHDVARCPFLGRNASDVTIEYCYIARNESTSPQHAEGISAYNAGSGPTNRWTVRWNIWKDVEGTGIIVFSGDSWKVYGNLFFHTTLSSNQGIGQGCVATWTGYSVTNAQVYNNTAVDLRLAPDTNTTGIYFSNSSSNTGNVAYNNIFYNCEDVSLDTYLTHSYNAFSNASSGSLAETGTGQYNLSSSIFTNYANDIFTLASSTDPGMTLSAPYNTDMLGIYRGAGGVWDRGAYEYEGSAQTNSRYVRQGASGSNNGLDWTNAWTQLPTSLVRGYTYYIADGTYPGYTFDDAVDGTKYIIIKKATTSDHGTGTGWNNSYGDGQATFSKSFSSGDTILLTFSTSYWEFNGQVGAGKGTVTPYGFVLNTDSAIPAVQTSYNSQQIYLNPSTAVSNIIIKYTELDTNDEGTAETGEDGRRSIIRQFYVNNGSSANLTIANNYFHDTTGVHIIFQAKDSTIENNYFARRYTAQYWDSSSSSYQGIHGEAISFRPTCSNIVVRYNIFEDVRGTGIVMAQDSTGFTDFYFYGNLAFTTDPSKYYTSNGFFATGDTNDGMREAYVYNNTMVDYSSSGQTGIRFHNDGGTNYAYNNLWYNCSGLNFLGVTRDYNAADIDLGEEHDQIIDSTYFVSYAGDDFRLSKATEAGMNLNSMTPPTTTTTVTATSTTTSNPTSSSTSSSTSTIYEGAPDCTKDNLKFFDNFEHPTLLSGGNYNDGMYNIEEGGGCTDHTDKTGDVYVENTYDHATDSTHLCTNVCVNSSQKVNGNYSLYFPCNGDRLIFGYGSSYNATPHIDWRLGTVKFFFRIEHYLDNGGSDSGSLFHASKGSNGKQGYIQCAIFGTGGPRVFRLSYNNYDGGGSQYVQTSTYDNLRADKWYYAVCNYRIGTTTPTLRVKVCDVNGTNCSTATSNVQLRPMTYGELSTFDLGEWNHQDLSGWIDDLYVYGDWRD